MSKYSLRLKKGKYAGRHYAESSGPPEGRGIQNRNSREKANIAQEQSRSSIGIASLALLGAYSSQSQPARHSRSGDGGSKWTKPICSGFNPPSPGHVAQVAGHAETELSSLFKRIEGSNVRLFTRISAYFRIPKKGEARPPSQAQSQSVAVSRSQINPDQTVQLRPRRRLTQPKIICKPHEINDLQNDQPSSS